MNQKDSKLKGRDFINLGIFTVIFIILFMACVFGMSLTVYTQPFGVALGSVVAGPVYMLLRTKTPKAGAVTLFGLLFSLVMLLMGSGWPISLSIFAGALIAEMIARSGDCRKYGRETLGYALLMCMTAAGSYIPLLTMKDYYRRVAEGNSIDSAYMINLLEFITGPYVILAIAVTFAAAFAGAFITRAIFRKHFIKAGLLKEMP